MLFSIQPTERDAYQGLFRRHEISKHYEAIAPWRPELSFPLRRDSRIVQGEPFFRQCEAAGEPNSQTRIEVLEISGAQARYGLSPVTGQKHQLRVHMHALGIPILGDGIYPVLTPEGHIDYAHPLQLLAKSIEWLDPITREVRRFESRRTLNFV